MDLYAPKIRDILEAIVVNKHDKLHTPCHRYIKTLTAPRLQAHVMRRNKDGAYALCLSKNDSVKLDGDGILYGYHRSTLPDIEALWASFVLADVATDTQPTKPVTKKPFREQVHGMVLMNTLTGELYQCTGKDAKTIAHDLKVSPYTVRLIVFHNGRKAGWQLQA